MRKEDRVKIMRNLGRTLLDELKNVSHRDGLLQVMGHSVRVKTQEVQDYQLKGPEHQVGAPVYKIF